MPFLQSVGHFKYIHLDSVSYLMLRSQKKAPRLLEGLLRFLAQTKIIYRQQQPNSMMPHSRLLWNHSNVIWWLSLYFFRNPSLRHHRHTD